MGLRRGLSPVGRVDARVPDLNMVVRVNMSPAEFVMDDLVEFVEGCMRVNDVAARTSASRSRVRRAGRAREDGPVLRSSSRWALKWPDDFGTGSLDVRAQDLPVDLLSWTSLRPGINSDRSTGHRRSIIASARRSLEVIAEGSRTGRS